VRVVIKSGLASCFPKGASGAIFMALSLTMSLPLFAACTVADIPGQAAPSSSEPAAEQVVSADAVCAAAQTKLEPQDPGALAKCECKSGGAARCVPTTKMPATLSDQLEKCDSDRGACVPDTIIASGGKPPPTCSSKGKEGRCLSMCVPLVAKYAATILTRGDGDACPTDERCVPCENPLDGTPTGICDIGKPAPASCVAGAGTGTPGSGIGATPGEPITCPFTGTPADVNRFPACGQGGRCLDANLVSDPRIAARLARCDKGLCVPEVYVKEKGQHLPTACTSFAGIEGRCFSTVFKDVSNELDFLQQDACTAAERCVPCFNPATGAPTGACDTVSCDRARATPRPLRDCCGSHGKCVPLKDVPVSFQSRLSAQGCTAGAELCAPSDNLDPNTKPVICAADGGKGVCVSNCVEFGFLADLILDRGSCRSDQTCVPCKDPTNGAPTNAPGCN
jgi:hypothetical protein